MTVAPRRRMTSPRPIAAAIAMLAFSSISSAQTPPPKEPPPLWDVQIGASFVGTSGNSDTASTGADFAAHRRGLVWLIDATATAVQTSTDDQTTAERYLAAFRAQRKLTRIIGLSAGEKVERDRFAGIDFAPFSTAASVGRSCGGRSGRSTA